jgi:hypothetical protein
MAPITVRRTVVAVVKQNNVAGTDFFESPPHIGGGLRLPVAPVYGPHHDSRESSTLRSLEELWTAEAVGWPDALSTFPGCLENRLIAPAQFVHNLLAAEENQAVMSERVISQRMISSGYLRHNLRVLRHILTKNKKSCGHIVPGKK